MKKLAAILMLLTVWFDVRAEVAIMGERVVDAARMAEFVSRHNPDFDPAIAEAFATVGDRYASAATSPSARPSSRQDGFASEAARRSAPTNTTTAA